ncbi:MAG TPA: type II secretion system secretin GspD, partial [Syntrophobacteria bacterium]|nr:type II secretion system secretin GspD [Syntrophobacteria bacterium]
QEAVTFLQPVVSKDGYISAFGPTNMLLMVDSYLNIEKVLGILQLIDTKQRREGGELLFLKNASAESAASVAREWLGSKEKTPTQRSPGQSVSAGAGGIIIPDTRLNALIVFGSDKEKEDVKKLIALIDVVPPTSSSKVNVYYLEYADATDMAKVLDGVIKGWVALSAAPGAAPPPSQQAAFEGGKITITPDKATNSLVIMASTTDYQNLLQVIQKLDKRRRQVFVEATIAEVSLTKLKELGIQWSFFGGASNGNIAGAGFYDTFNSLSSFTQLLSSLVTAGVVRQEALLGSSANFAAILKLLDSTGTVNVLSTPNILTSDNKEAEIFVGENIPLIGQTNLSSTGLSQQSITRQDTGIILRITPQISEGDYVKLDIYQEISAVKPISDPKATDITTTKRSAKTAVVVKNAETVVIGGLISERVTEQITKVPLLGDIPLLGWAFKSTSTQREKTNLLIILQPHIIKSVEDLAEITTKQSARFEEKSGQSKLESPEEETKKPQ